MTIAAVEDLILEQGTTWRQPFTWESSPGVPVDLTGWTARMQVRETASSPAVLLDLTTSNNGLVISALTGTITTHVTDTVTSALSFTSAVYDLELIDPSGNVTRLVRGNVMLSPEVTR